MFHSGGNVSIVWDNVTWRWPGNDRLGAARIAPTLYLGDRRAADPADGCAVHHTHDRRHLPDHRHPRRAGGVELQRPHHRGHGTPCRFHHRTRLFHHGQRHPAHRIAVDPEYRHPEGVFPARHRHRQFDRADHIGEQLDPARCTTRNAAAGRDPVQCLERAGRADDPVEQDADRATDLRLQPELHPRPAVHHPRTLHPRTIRRQVTADHRRSRPVAAGGERLRPGGRRERATGLQRHRAGGHGAAGRSRIQRAAELQPDRGGTLQRTADRGLQRRAGDHRRRRQGQRQLRHPGERGARQRQARGLSGDPEARRCLYAAVVDAAAMRCRNPGRCAGGVGTEARLRPVGVRTRRGAERDPRGDHLVDPGLHS